EIYRRLPLDSPSRRTPLPLVNASHYQGAFGTSTLEFAPVPGAPQKSGLASLAGPLFLCFVNIFSGFVRPVNSHSSFPGNLNM
ncbi:hypothetical protein, partial [Longitalea arenae]|uniref:hypothetical protein n=1 Tax=Longitalea arenae TaxID=2812558 RepID=UPI001966DA6D